MLRCDANKKNVFSRNATINRESVKNAVRIIFQLRMLRDMFVAQNTNHTHAILTRVDVLFVRPIVAAKFTKNVVTPNYADFHGVNDRFSAGPIKKILLLMDRLDVWKRTDRLAELLMLATCKAYGIIPQRTAVGYNRRVRIGGILHKSQYKHDNGCALDTAKTMSHLLPYATTVIMANSF